MAPKGKAPTKGAKQILTENAATVSFYRNMALGAGAAYNIVTVMFYYESITVASLVMNIFVIAVDILCYQTMLYISRPTYYENSQVMDAGIDLNMEGGVGEHVKDIVILSSVTHLLAIFSNYFWLLLLFMPLRALWLLWTNILGPWFFQSEPVEYELDEKKKRKMERKMNRHNYQ
ncbi:transmembrane protein 208 isoform X2 [Bicyclus anynana]|uniref:Transmembrane protein 208 n=1 Tax=Bicyclus anynana TaxID=110368 RepID=A0A6J1MW01_BICAN|nr:transmembrane protein 208 isoform X2 [Bicyclus anynana]